MRRPEFVPGCGLPARVLRCVPYEQVSDQFAQFDRYIWRRLHRLRHVHWGFVDPSGDTVRLDGEALRRMGLRTFKDVANRVPHIQWE